MPRFGTWSSPITAQSIAASTIGLSGVSVDGDCVYWLEGRPQEGGRTVLVRRRPDGQCEDVSPAGSNVRSRVHEYGGGAYVVHDGEAFYVNFADQRIYRKSGDAPPVALTSEGAGRFADFIVDPVRRRLIGVRETHDGGAEPVNTLVSVPMDVRGGDEEPAEPAVLASGHDFYATPRLSADGRWLAWLCWRHPNMPWDGTDLYVAALTTDGRIRDDRRVAGGVDESICQPRWHPNGDLYFVSDRDDWWRLYRVTPVGMAVRGPVEYLPVIAEPPARAEFGVPQWVFGIELWAFQSPTTIVATFTRDGYQRLAVIDIPSATCTEIPTDLSPGERIAVRGTDVFMEAATETQPAALVRLSLDGGHVEVLRRSVSVTIDEGYLSRPEPISFPTDGGLEAHAFFYPPTNRDCQGEPGERPPLVVMSHGGPTAAARPILSLGVQYWTSRGFGVVDVNYGGSSGYGRAYRQRLNGQWGVVDVADCINAARYLVARGDVDPNRLCIRGGSAGGYVTLAALTFHPGVFKAGASHYGIADIEVLARDTHKFESRYLDTLIGPYPEMQPLYRARSPIHALDRMNCPLIVLQGTEDRVVPPNQAEMMAEALRAKGLPVALLMFEGEGHGFRKAESIVRAREAELWFYGAVFGFTPADAIAPVEVANLPRRA